MNEPYGCISNGVGLTTISAVIMRRCAYQPCTLNATARVRLLWPPDWLVGVGVLASYCWHRSRLPDRWNDPSLQGQVDHMCGLSPSPTLPL